MCGLGFEQQVTQPWKFNAPPKTSVLKPISHALLQSSNSPSKVVGQVEKLNLNEDSPRKHLSFPTDDGDKENMKNNSPLTSTPKKKMALANRDRLSNKERSVLRDSVDITKIPLPSTPSPLKKHFNAMTPSTIPNTSKKTACKAACVEFSNKTFEKLKGEA